MVVERNVIVRTAVRADIPAIKAIEIELGLSPWSERDYMLELERDDSVFLVLAEKEQVVGFLLARLITSMKIGVPISLPDGKHLTISEIEIYNIGIEKTKQRSGYGSRLLSALLRETQNEKPTRILLDVRTSNIGAISFYEQHEFFSTGSRRNFYRNPTEDSIVMRRDLLYEHAPNT